MKLIELECKNCGATLKVDENTENVNCPYCNATYKIDDEVKHIQYDNMENSGYEFEKGRIKAQEEHLENNDKITKPKLIIILIPVIIAIIGTVIIIVASMSASKKISETFNNEDNTQSVIENQIENQKLEEEAKKKELELQNQRDTFNMKYSSGRKATVFVKSMLEDALNNNQTNQERKITVVYNDITTQDPGQIIEVEKQLKDFSEYDIMIDYDEEGFVNKITIK